MRSRDAGLLVAVAIGGALLLGCAQGTAGTTTNGATTTNGTKPVVAALPMTNSAPIPYSEWLRRGRQLTRKSPTRALFAEVVTLHPLALRLCRALHALPRERRAACCTASTSYDTTSECARTLSASLNARALTLEAGAVARCETAQAALHQGCGWVGPVGQPLPTACEGLLAGALPYGARCRSTLECSGRLHCQGVGPTTAGYCLSPKRARMKCGQSVDPLAVFTRQSTMATSHPECEGFCEKHVCQHPLRVGQACSADVQCGRGLHCNGRCTRGEHARVGQSCSSRCETGSRCVAGRCIHPREEGASCSNSFDCFGGCVFSANARTGRCGSDCSPLVTWPRIARR